MVVISIVLIICVTISYFGYLDYTNFCKHKFQVLDTSEHVNHLGKMQGYIYSNRCELCGTIEKKVVRLINE